MLEESQGWNQPTRRRTESANLFGEHRATALAECSRIHGAGAVDGAVAQWTRHQRRVDDGDER